MAWPVGIVRTRIPHAGSRPRDNDSKPDLGLGRGIRLAAATWLMIIAAALLLAGCASRVEPLAPSSPMSRGPFVGALAKWTDFLARHPDQEAAATETIALTDEVWRRLDRVNRGVNNYPYVSDRPARGVAYTAAEGYGLDHWDLLADAGGDCEDFALTKRKRLAAEGMPIGALRLALATIPEGIGHAVLIVVTDAGDYVLDNNTDEIRPWRDTPYVWHARAREGVTWEQLL